MRPSLKHYSLSKKCASFLNYYQAVGKVMTSFSMQKYIMIFPTTQYYFLTFHCFQVIMNSLTMMLEPKKKGPVSGKQTLILVLPVPNYLTTLNLISSFTKLLSQSTLEVNKFSTYWSQVSMVSDWSGVWLEGQQGISISTDWQKIKSKYPSKGDSYCPYLAY